MRDAEHQAKTRFERLSLLDSPHPALRATFLRPHAPEWQTSPQGGNACKIPSVRPFHPATAPLGCGAARNDLAEGAKSASLLR